MQMPMVRRQKSETDLLYGRLDVNRWSRPLRIPNALGKGPSGLR